jgi:hypothetical protein
MAWSDFLDQLFVFETSKVVAIHDKQLGCLRYSLMLIVAVYVLVYQIWYCGDHFAEETVVPNWRVELTWTGCDFLNPKKDCGQAPTKKLTELPYCTVYTGPDPAPVQKECENFNAEEIFKPLLGGHMIPSYVEHYYLKQVCAIDATECPQKYAFTDATGKELEKPKPVKEIFVGESEHFKLLVQHTFQTEESHKHWHAHQMKGYWSPTSDFCKLKGWDDCDDQPIATKSRWPGATLPIGHQSHEAVSLQQKHRKSSRHPSAFLGNVPPRSLDNRSLYDPSDVYDILMEGEVIELDTIYAMGGRLPDELKSSYDKNRDSEEKRHYGGGKDDTALLETIDGLTDEEDYGRKEIRRQRSRFYVMNIKYNNYLPWNSIIAPRDPEYSISFMSMHGASRTRYTEMRDLDDNEQKNVTGSGDFKKFSVYYGPIVLIKSGGTIGAFSLGGLLLFLMGLAVFEGLVHAFTEAVAVNFSSNASGIQKLKYQEVTAEQEQAAQHEAEEEEAAYAKAQGEQAEEAQEAEAK